jgi:hypothetical protein
MSQIESTSEKVDEKSNEKQAIVQTAATETLFQHRDATDDEIEKYPHITDKIPLSAWIVILAGAAERATYFGIIAPWRSSLLFST